MAQSKEGRSSSGAHAVIDKVRDEEPHVSEVVLEAVEGSKEVFRVSHELEFSVHLAHIKNKVVELLGFGFRLVLDWERCSILSRIVIWWRHIVGVVGWNAGAAAS